MKDPLFSQVQTLSPSRLAAFPPSLLSKQQIEVFMSEQIFEHVFQECTEDFYNCVLMITKK